MANAEVRRHNEEVLKSLGRGDLVEFPRGAFSHWAVYGGNGMVVHLTCEKDRCGDCCQGHKNGVVREDNFLDVADENKAKRNNSLDTRKIPFLPHKIVFIAMSRRNEADYNLIWKNCEHFATSCRYGKATSDQSSFWVKAGGVVVAAFACVASFVVGATLSVPSKIKK